MLVGARLCNCGINGVCQYVVPADVTMILQCVLLCFVMCLIHNRHAGVRYASGTVPLPYSRACAFAVTKARFSGCLNWCHMQGRTLCRLYSL
jgi:hypothetical protein